MPCHRQRRPPTPSPIKCSGTRLNPNPTSNVQSGFLEISSQLKKTVNAGEELYDLDKIRKSKNPRIKVVKTTTDHMTVPIVNFILGCNHFGYSLKK
jgi:hypothetical protein